MDSRGSAGFKGELTTLHIRGPHGDVYRFFAWLLNLPARAWQWITKRLT